MYIYVYIRVFELPGGCPLNPPRMRVGAARGC